MAASDEDVAVAQFTNLLNDPRLGQYATPCREALGALASAYQEVEAELRWGAERGGLDSTGVFTAATAAIRNYLDDGGGREPLVADAICSHVTNYARGCAAGLRAVAKHQRERRR